MTSVPTKRASSTSLESIAAADLPAPKKQRLDPEAALNFNALTEEVSVEIPVTYPIDFNFSELAHEFVSTPVPGNEISSHTFESFFTDPPLNTIPSHETSEISSDNDKPDCNTNSKSSKSKSSESTAAKVASSPVSSDSQDKPGEEPSSSPTKNQSDPHQKRQADRAARNRESSRRAREKAKNRFRALESDNMALREMVRRFRMQNEHLLTQLDRANVMQQSCTMCRYNAAMAQQPNCQPSSSSALRH